MEYFPLGDLLQFIAKTRPMVEVDVRVIISQVLEGLCHMHCEGFAHRDIKPGVRFPAPLGVPRRLTSNYL
jgi:calcium/calmodulin-dependent protein kinase I